MTGFPKMIAQGRSAWPAAHPGGLGLAAFWTAIPLLLAAHLLGADLEGQASTLAATAIFLFGGLPHGAYDINLLGRVSQGRRTRLAIVTAVYIGMVVAMILAWRLWPGAALIFFLIAAAFHFGEDWDLIDDALLRMICGASVAAAPALAHPEHVAAIFSNMTAGRGGTAVAMGLFLIAPVVIVITGVCSLIVWQRGARITALTMVGALSALLLFPPVIGFALYFVCLHSPRHLATAQLRLSSLTWQWRIGTAVALPIAAIGIWVAATGITGGAITPDLTAQAFQLLAALTIPHLIISSYLERRTSEPSRPHAD
ncbi:MAG: Brp/Blh family beta-carotene 15,15'-dioxygenase [Paracoccus sp. (in: a-proteobacteria)]|nr:Brp/Blh family beta-carotene 15,15'-dioxygenase [Paracoccus sp. (in: a-proteobacteria)]